MKFVTIRPKPTKAKPKGFDPNIKTKSRKNWRHVAIELNVEAWEAGEDFPDFHNSEILDVLEIHHIVIRPVESQLDRNLIAIWSEQIAGSVYISPVEFLAEVYTTQLNDHALAIGANIGRIYHNSCLGDTRLHPNSIGHVFEPTDGKIPDQVIAVLNKYVTVEHIADGQKVTLKNRLGI